MAGIYDSGFGGDFGGSYGGYDLEEEERRRQREMQEAAQRQSPYQTPTQADEKRQPQYQNQSPAQQQEPERDQRREQDTRTFAQRQAAGEARPAPPPPVPPAVAPYEQAVAVAPPMPVLQNAPAGLTQYTPAQQPVIQNAPADQQSGNALQRLQQMQQQAGQPKQAGNYSRQEQMLAAPEMLALLQQAGPSGPDGPMSGTAPGMGGDAGNVGGSTLPPDSAVAFQPNMPVLKSGPTYSNGERPQTAPTGSTSVDADGVTWTKRGPQWVVEGAEQQKLIDAENRRRRASYAAVPGVYSGGIDPLKVAMGQVSAKDATGMIEEYNRNARVEVPVTDAPVYKGGEVPPASAPNGSQWISDQGVPWIKRGLIWVVEGNANQKKAQDLGYEGLSPDWMNDQNAKTIGYRTGLSTAGVEQFTKRFGGPKNEAQLKALAGNLTNVEMPNSFRTNPVTGEQLPDEVFKGNLAEFLGYTGEDTGMGAGAGPGGPAEGGSNTGMGNAGPETEAGTNTAAAPATQWRGTMPVSYGTPSGGTRSGAANTSDMGAYLQAQLANSGISGAGIDPVAAAAGTKNRPEDTLEMQRRLTQALDNPSAFDNEEVVKLYNRLGQGIDDQFAQQQTALREEMARRGLADSSIQGGRLSDLNIGQRQARTELADRLGTARAQDYAAARNTLLGLGLQSQGQDNSYSLQMANLERQREQDALARQLGWYDRSFNYGQQAFNNDLQMAEFNRLLQNDQDQMMLKLLGLGA